MKALFTLIFTVCMALNAYAAISPINRSTNVKYDGSIDAATLEKEFIKIINRDGSTTAKGTLMCLSLTEDDGASAVSCPTTAGGSPICMLAESCADDKLCLCQTYGLNEDALFKAGAGSATAGKPFFHSESVAGGIQAIASPDGSDNAGGVFYDASSATGAVQVFLKLK
jgi:hypothetical protein